MNSLISPNQPQSLLLQPHQLGQSISAIKPLLHPCFSKCRSRKVYAEGKSRGFPGRSKKEAEAEAEAGPTTKPPVADDDDDDELSPEVKNRIITRVLVYVGVPMGVGLGMLQLFGTLKENHIQVPLWVTFITTFLAFGLSALGVPFGALSSSWDPNQQGSLLGFKEISQNWDKMWEQDTT